MTIKTTNLSFNINNDFQNHLYFIAVYPMNQSEFWNTISQFIQSIRQFSPFSNFLSVKGIFPSEDIRQDIDFKQEGETIDFNRIKALDFFKKISLQCIDNNLFSFLENHSTKTIIILLSPLNPENSLGGESVFIDNNSLESNIISTTKNGFWGQYIIKVLCKKLGLADEYELSNEQYLAPDINSGSWLNFLYPNLIYAENEVEALIISKSKWKPLIQSAPEIKKYSGHPEQADFTIPTNNYQPEKIQLHEGGGGYRTKVYRSAHDCLMRRQIGNPNLPVRALKVPLCPVCEAYIRSKLLDAARYNSSDPFEFRQSMIQLNT